MAQDTRIVAESDLGPFVLQSDGTISIRNGPTINAFQARHSEFGFANGRLFVHEGLAKAVLNSGLVELYEYHSGEWYSVGLDSAEDEILRPPSRNLPHYFRNQFAKWRYLTSDNSLSTRAKYVLAVAALTCLILLRVFTASLFLPIYNMSIMTYIFIHVLRNDKQFPPRCLVGAKAAALAVTAATAIACLHQGIVKIRLLLISILRDPAEAFGFVLELGYHTIVMAMFGGVLGFLLVAAFRITLISHQLSSRTLSACQRWAWPSSRMSHFVGTSLLLMCLGIYISPMAISAVSDEHVTKTRRWLIDLLEGENTDRGNNVSRGIE